MLAEDPAVKQRVVPIAGGQVGAHRAEDDHQDDERHPRLPPDAGRDEDGQLDLNQQTHALIGPLARAAQLQGDQAGAARDREVQKREQSVGRNLEDVTAEQDAGGDQVGGPKSDVQPSRAGKTPRNSRKQRGKKAGGHAGQAFGNR